MMEADGTLQFPKLAGVGAPERPTCADCVFYSCNPGNFKEGRCHGNPPTIMFQQTKNGLQPLAIRPGVSLADIACHLFHPLRQPATNPLDSV